MLEIVVRCGFGRMVVVVVAASAVAVVVVVLGLHSPLLDDLLVVDVLVSTMLRGHRRA